MPITTPTEALLGLHVRCYRNLHHGLFSVQHKGRVVAHVATLTLADARFTVQPAGQARVLATGQKQVHAFVSGTVTDLATLGERVSYDPYKAGAFTATDGQPVTRAPLATLAGTGVYI